MSGIYGDASQTSVSRTSEAGQRQVRLLRDGAIIGVDWIQSLVMEGRVHGVNVGTGTTPVATNPTYAVSEPDLYLAIPAGTVVIPLYIGIAAEDTGTILTMDTFAAYHSNGGTAATGTSLTIYNMKTLSDLSSNCVATNTVTSTGTSHLGGTDFLEFWRPYAGLVPDHFNAAAAVNMQGKNGPNSAEWCAKTHIAPLVGSPGTACAISIFAGAQAGVVFMNFMWAELPASAF